MKLNPSLDQARAVKFGWVVITFLGFTLAAYLIAQSLCDWAASPVSTTVSTHEIADLEFPVVTVCPPRGSNTALNYDLMKADNASLSGEGREILRSLVWEEFIKGKHEDYVQTMKAAANPSRLKLMFEGYQSVPKPYSNNGLEIRMWNFSGSIHSPRFGELFSKEEFKADVDLLHVLEFPDNILESLGSGSLVLELEVETREEEGWLEEVTYQAGARYRQYNMRKTWQEAETFCEGEGGHLASILTSGQLAEAVEAATHADASLWIGASKSVEEVWSWADGAKFDFSHWGDIQHAAYRCARMYIGDQSGVWYQSDCDSLLIPFICKFEPNILKGKMNLSFRYTKEQLDFQNFHVHHSYKVASKEVLDSIKDKNTTGFRLSWRVESPGLGVVVTETGRMVESPQFGRVFDGGFYNENISHQATLEFADDIAEQVGDGSLVIQLEVQTREQEGWQEVVQYLDGPSLHMFKVPLSWDDAEKFCVARGGHLASILSEREQKAVAALTDPMAVWLGARETQEGTWTWRDGTQVDYQRWRNVYEDKLSCTAIVGWEWYQSNCYGAYYPLCAFQSFQLKGNSNITLSFSQKELSSFSSSDSDINKHTFKVWHKYRATDLELLDSLEVKSITGFRLNWFIQDINGDRVTEPKPDIDDEDWKTLPAVPRFHNLNFVAMVNLAKNARVEGLSREDFTKRVLAEKYEMSKKDIIENIDCSGGQIKYTKNKKVFDLMAQNTIDNTFPIHSNITEEDIRIGFEIYSITALCSDSYKLGQFLYELVSSQSPRDIIQATMNTIQSPAWKQWHNRDMLNTFYESLDTIFNFNIGPILIASAKPHQLQSFLDQELPYLKPYRNDIEICINDNNCEGLVEFVNSLGIIT